MEEIINRVVSIDKKASDILRETEQYLDFKEKDIKNKIETMRNEAMEKTKNDAKALYECTMHEAEEEADKIRANAKSKSDSLSDRFSRIRDKLESGLFSRIFK